MHSVTEVEGGPRPLRIGSGLDDGRDDLVDGFSESGVVRLVALGRDGRKLPL